MKPVHWIIAGLVLVIILLILFDKDPGIDSSVWKSRITELETEIKQIEQERTTIAERIKSDSLESLESKRRYDSTILVQKSRISDLKRNPVVITIRDSVPEIDSLIVAYDSAVQVRDNRITELEHINSKLSINMQAITLNFESQLQLERGKFEASQAMNQATEKENKRLKRGNKWLKAGAVVGVVGAFLLGSQL